jgi:ketosteroid isomerase-like protein
MKEQATRLLHAFATSDLPAIDELCADDALLWGTDVDEAWHGKQAILDAFSGTFDLGVGWIGEPVEQDDWVAGHVEFVLGDGGVVPARVTMVFREGLLAHAHYSVAVRG